MNRNQHTQNYVYVCTYMVGHIDLEGLFQAGGSMILHVYVYVYLFKHVIYTC